MSDVFSISDLRKELGMSLGEFAGLVGLSSKGHLSLIERENRAALGVALKIEELSGGRIDAADLNDDVRAARAGLAHDNDPIAPAAEAGDGLPFPRVEAA